MEKNNVNTNQNEEVEIDLREIFGVLMGRIVLILMVGVICAVAAGVITKLCITPQYQSTTKMYVLSKGEGASVSGVSGALTSLTDLQMGSQVLIDYEAMMLCDPVMEKVIKNLELDMTNKELADSISINNPDNTRTLEITVTNSDPYIAREIADEVAKVSAEYCADVMDVQPPDIYQEAQNAKYPSGPNTKKNVVIAFFVGAFLVCAVIVVRYILDDTIQSQEDIEKYLGMNTLGLIPIEEGSIEQLKKDRKKRKKGLN